MIQDGKKLWCDKHWTPFRNGLLKREVDGVAASTVMREKVLGSQKFLKLCKNKTDAATVEAAMEGIAPVCCWMGDATVDEVYGKCKVG